MYFVEELLFGLLLVASSFLILPRFLRKNVKRLPGPLSLPLLGNMLQIMSNAKVKLFRWAEIYGDIYVIKLASRKAVVMNSAKVIKNILGRPASTGKFKCDSLLLLSRGPYGMINTEGPAAMELRRFAIKNLREFGYGKSSLEPMILVEADQIVSWINERSQSSEDIDAKKLYNILHTSTNSALWALMTGSRVSLGDEKLNTILENTTEGVQRTVRAGLGYFPWLKYISRERTGYNFLDKATEALSNFVKEEFERQKQSYEPGKVRHLMDSFIEHLQLEHDPSSCFYGQVGYQNSIATFGELFIGGAETMSGTITWACIYLATHPNVQQKLREEIHNVLGDNEEPSLQHKTSMRYLEAVILEVFRFSSLAPLGVTHELLEDINYDGYDLPRGTLLIANLYHVQHNKALWGDPENFRPERFLEKGNEILRESVLPFQAGRRVCPGEPLARDSVFLYLAKVFQKLEVTTDINVSKERYFEQQDGILALPGAHKLIFKRNT